MKSFFEIGDFAQSLETGWVGKIVAFEEHSGERLAKMVGFDGYARMIGSKPIEECLCLDDIQWFTLDDLVRLPKSASHP